MRFFGARKNMNQMSMSAKGMETGLMTNSMQRQADEESKCIANAKKRMLRDESDYSEHQEDEDRIDVLWLNVDVGLE